MMTSSTAHDHARWSGPHAALCRRRFLSVAFGLGLLAVFGAPGDAQAQFRTPGETQPQTPSYATRSRTAAPPVQGVFSPHGMVVAQETRAAQIGRDILARGGNAVDAAVAVGFAMAVTYPRAGNIGGGGFMVIHCANGEDAAIDYRETAPAAITPTTFLDGQGNADAAKSRRSPLGIGVPGTVAGFALALEKYGSGRFTWADLVAPAVTLAREGIPVEDDTADSLPSVRNAMARWPASAKIFLKPDGNVLAAGDRLVQSDLADTLETIAREGAPGFYRGAVAQKLADAVQAAGGVISVSDLAAYTAKERTPVRGTYRGFTVVSMPPPSSGGVHLIEMLNILEGYPSAEIRGPDGPHLLAEVMKRAYADRATFLGDPDRVDVPVAGLISKDYARALRAQIDLTRARPANDIRPGTPSPHEGDNTTHFSVVDREGNAVANTYTLNFSYGLSFVAAGTGVLLNNELDDFAVKPFAPNAFGLVGFEANAPAPGKRPLSSMTPTILLKDGKPVMVTGSPGGSRIITTVLQVIVNVIDGGLSLADAVAAPRLHHQWQPDQVVVEDGYPPAQIADLQRRGHSVIVRSGPTSANSIIAVPGGFIGAADTRTRGALAIGD